MTVVIIIRRINNIYIALKGKSSEACYRRKMNKKQTIHEYVIYEYVNKTRAR